MSHEPSKEPRDHSDFRKAVLAWYKGEEELRMIFQRLKERNENTGTSNPRGHTGDDTPDTPRR